MYIYTGIHIKKEVRACDYLQEDAITEGGEAVGQAPLVIRLWKVYERQDTGDLRIEELEEGEALDDAGMGKVRDGEKRGEDVL